MPYALLLSPRPVARLVRSWITTSPGSGFRFFEEHGTTIDASTRWFRAWLAAP